MTAAARLVLADCEAALQDLIESHSGSMWRRRWFALVALLRSVGHVLDKVDGPTNKKLATIIADEYSKLKDSKPEPIIYWRFIKEERDIVIKEYKFRAYKIKSGYGVTGITTPFNLKTGKTINIKANEYHEAHAYLFKSGPFEGRREVDVATEAIQWWLAYLESIDQQRK